MLDLRTLSVAISAQDSNDSAIMSTPPRNLDWNQEAMSDIPPAVTPYIAKALLFSSKHAIIAQHAVQ